MNTKDACAFLGTPDQPISKRTLQRYAHEGLLTVRYIPGAGTRSVADYDEDELRALQEQQQAAHEQPAAKAVALAPRRERDGAQLVALLERLLERATPQLPNPAAVPVTELLVLTPAQAAALSGLSEHFIRAHLREMKAKKLGRGWMIKRTDLDAFVKRL